MKRKVRKLHLKKPAELRRSKLLPHGYSTPTTMQVSSGSFFTYGDKDHCVEVQSIRNLIASIIDRALIDIQLASVDGSVKRSSLQWLTSNNTDEWSFYWCLMQLGYNKEDGKKMVQLALKGDYDY